MKTFLDEQERIIDRIDQLTAIIKRLNDAMKFDLATINRLRHEVDLERARAEVAEALLRGRARGD